MNSTNVCVPQRGYNMKIYTVTFNRTTNWGATFQEYALFAYLRKLGHDVKVVDYVPEFMLEKHRPINKIRNAGGIISKFQSLLLLPLYLDRAKKFREFTNEHIVYTVACKNINDIEKLSQPDLYICGSDQIWNTNFVGDDQVYFLNFKTSANKISYAASMGKDKISKTELDDLCNRISNIQITSVREDYLFKKLASRGISPLYHVLDPVFLLDKNEYIRIADDSKSRNDYVLVYELANDYKCYQVARKLADTYNLEIIQINCFKKRYPVDKVLGNPSPTEFLRLFIDAKYVVTNSFHGTAFSIILNKQFYAIQLKTYNSRIASLLKLVKLENRIIREFDNNMKMEYINYEGEIEETLNEAVNASKDILEKSLI